MPENFDDSLPRPQREDLCGRRGEIREKKNAEPTGLEPATSAVTGQRSDRLS